MSEERETRPIDEPGGCLMFLNSVGDFIILLLVGGLIVMLLGVSLATAHEHDLLLPPVEQRNEITGR